MILKAATVSFAVALLGIASASAETVGIAASKKGSLYDRSGTVIAKVVTNRGGLRVTLRNYTSPSVYIPAVNRGQVAFGLANRIEIALAVAGKGHFEGRKHPNIRAVTIMYPLRIAFFVKKDSPIKTIADLKGKKVPDGFVAQKIILKLMCLFAAARKVACANECRFAGQRWQRHRREALLDHVVEREAPEAHLEQR